MATKKKPADTFDANKRREARGKRKCVIGSKEYTLARDSTEQRASRRKINRVVDGITAETAKIRAADDELSEKDLDRLDELDSELEEALYAQIANVLVDDQGNKPDGKLIAEGLDMADVDGFWAWFSEDSAPENPS